MPDIPVLPVRPRLGPRAWALIIPAGAIVVALLVGILLVLTSVRSQIVEQNQRTRLLIQKADPSFKRAPAVLDDAAPLLRDAAPVLKASRAAIPEARRAARDGRELLEMTRPVVAGLAPVVAGLAPVVADLGPVVADLAPVVADLAPVADRLAPVVTALGPVLADLGPAAADLRPIARELRAADLPRVLGDVQRAASAGGRALPVLLDLVTEVRDRELLRRASRTLPTIGRIAQLQRAAVEVNRETLTRTSTIEGLFRESLDIQRRILARAESIDRKLPGPTAAPERPGPGLP